MSEINEDLRKWFREKWVRFDTKGNIKGDCAREPGEGKPKCLPQSKAHALGKEKRASAARRKRREDPHAGRKGKAKFVKTHNEETINEIRDVVTWYTFTPEVSMTFPTHSIVKSLLNDQLTGKLSSWSSRIKIHQKLWPSIQDKVKLVGFEANSSPGTMPAFMREFKDTVMRDVIETNHCFTYDELKNLIL